VLCNRQLVPPLTIHTPDGRTVRAWDYKQKKNLVIAFLNTDCEPCEEFLRTLAASAAALREKDAVALVVFLEQPARRLTDSLPPGIIVGADMPGKPARAFLGEDTFASRGFVRGGVFVTDRYGELFAQWIVERYKFPAIAEILKALDLVEMACDECSTPLWTAD
jgi:thiol-disulfide isomerase/thioredoxin